MNEYLLLTLLERLLSLYTDNRITLNEQDQFTHEFKSLIGEVKDAISHVE